MVAFLDRRTFLKATAASISTLAAPAVHASCAEAGRYRIRRKRDFQSFDPIDVRGEDEVVTRNIMAPLVRATQPRAGAPEWDFVPHLATNFERNDEATMFELEIGNQEWSDGSRITVEDVITTIARVSGLGTGQRTPNSFRWENLKTVSASGALRIELEEPDADFISNVLPWGAACIAQGAFASGYGSTSFGLDEGPTSGRYKVCALRPNESLQLAYDTRWNGDEPTIKAAEFVIVPDDVTADHMLAAGELQAMRATPNVLFNTAGFLRDRLERGDDLRIFDTPNSSVRYLAINGLRLEAPELRSAIQSAVSRQNVLNAVYGEVIQGETLAVAAESFLPGHVLGASSELPIEFNPEEARHLVRQIRQIDEPLKIGVSFPVHRLIANAIAEELRRVDLPVEVVNIEFGDVLSGRAEEDLDMLVQTTFAQGLDPSQAARQFTTDGRPFGFASAEYDALFQELAFTLDFEARILLLDQLQSIVLGAGAILPIEDVRDRWIVDGFTPTFMPDGRLGDIGDWEPSN